MHRVTVAGGFVTALLVQTRAGADAVRVLDEPSAAMRKRRSPSTMIRAMTRSALLS